jgi:hypothetical protein
MRFVEKLLYNFFFHSDNETKHVTCLKANMK